MKNRKFSLLINEFSQMSKLGNIKLGAEQCLVCHYKGRDIRIEDGQRIGLTNHIVIVAPLNVTVSREIQGEINGNFALSKDSYLAEIKSLGCCLIRHCVLPEYPRTLLGEVNQSLSIVNKILKEIENDVAD